MTIRVIMTATIKAEDCAAFEAAYLQVTENVRGTPGHIRDELVRDFADPTKYALLAEWENEELFHVWADDPEHIKASAPMFPYWEGTFQRAVYDLRATLESYSRAAPAESPAAV